MRPPMNQACVSLEEVLAAAGARAASLVPETSGYLALAVADATSRMPYAHEDRGVLLTIDGTVMVPRKAPITAPPEAARVLRDLLKRLLATSTGTMPGLASAARPRSEEHDVDRVVGDIEAALIPVNRAAAKRALARLSRETLRAKELGKLKKKSVPPPSPSPATPSANGSRPPTPGRSVATSVEQRSAAPAAAPVIAPAPTPVAAPAPVVAPAAAIQVVAAPVAVHVAPVAVAAPPAPPAPPATVHVAPPALVVVPPPHVEQAEAIAPVVHVERAPEIAPPPMVIAPPFLLAEVTSPAPAIAAPPCAETPIAPLAESAPAPAVFAAPILDIGSTEAVVVAASVEAAPIVTAPIVAAPIVAKTPAAPIVASAVLAPEAPSFTPTPFIDVEMSVTPLGGYVTAVIPDLGTDMPPPTTDAPAVVADAPSLATQAPLHWADSDATIADPDAMAVIEAIYRQGSLAEGDPDLDDGDLTAAPSELHEARAVSPSPDDAILTRPMHAPVAPVAPVPHAREVPRKPDVPRIVAHPTEYAVPDALTAEAAPVALLAQLSGSRADELLEAFHPEDQGDPALLAAAGSLRAFTGVDEASSPRPTTQRPTFLRVSPPSRRGGPALPDIDDDLPMPAPRPRNAAAPTRWPLALFAVGVLVLFAAWLYRPTLAHDFFGLVTSLRPAAAPAQTPPATADTSAPGPAALPAPLRAPAATETPAATPQRGRDARAAAASGDGARRRRD